MLLVRIWACSGLIGGWGVIPKESEILRVATEDLDECRKTLEQLKISDDYHGGDRQMV